MVNYTYDADGIRVCKSVDGVVTNYLVDKNRYYAQVLEERDGGAGLIASYVYGDDLISMYKGGIISFYHYDGNGNTRQLTDTVENVKDTYIYDAFGIMLDRMGTTENNYMYTGEQYDANVKFYYLRARYYNVEVGRFINMDPFNGNIYDPLSLHKYLYTESDPVNNIDPSGFFSLAGAMTAIAISAVLVSIAFPNLRGLLAKFTGNTDRFSLQFTTGLAGGKILFGGFINAFIWEERPSSGYYRHCFRGHFIVWLLGLGGGFKAAAYGAVIATEAVTFKSATRRKIYDFRGIGRITAIEYGFYLVAIGWGAIHLPDGTYIPASLKPGVAAAITKGFAAYVVMSIWQLVKVEQLW